MILALLLVASCTQAPPAFDPAPWCSQLELALSELQRYLKRVETDDGSGACGSNATAGCLAMDRMTRCHALAMTESHLEGEMAGVRGAVVVEITDALRPKKQALLLIFAKFGDAAAPMTSVASWCLEGYAQREAGLDGAKDFDPTSGYANALARARAAVPRVEAVIAECKALK